MVCFHLFYLKILHALSQIMQDNILYFYRFQQMPPEYFLLFFYLANIYITNPVFNVAVNFYLFQFKIVTVRTYCHLRVIDRHFSNNQFFILSQLLIFQEKQIPYQHFSYINQVFLPEKQIQAFHFRYTCKKASSTSPGFILHTSCF